MPRFAANLSFLFPELELPARIDACAAAGFGGVEMLFPYAWPAGRLKSWLDSAGVEMALINAPPGDWSAGERGLAALTGRERDCQDAIERALEFAAALDCPRVHVMAGIADPADPDAHATYLANLAWATGRASAAGATLTIEPINRGDMPGYFLTTADQAARVLDEVAAPDFGLQLDLYHAQATTGDAEAVLATHLPRTAHIQIAGHPGRGEPDRGTLPWTRLLDRLDRADYAGWVGCEYRPESSTAAGLSRWGAPYGLGM